MCRDRAERIGCAARPQRMRQAPAWGRLAPPLTRAPTPLGSRLPSDLDDPIHFEFRTAVTTPGENFNPSMADPGSFAAGSFAAAVLSAHSMTPAASDELFMGLPVHGIRLTVAASLLLALLISAISAAGAAPDGPRRTGRRGQAAWVRPSAPLIDAHRSPRGSANARPRRTPVAAPTRGQRPRSARVREHRASPAVRRPRAKRGATEHDGPPPDLLAGDHADAPRVEREEVLHPRGSSRADPARCVGPTGVSDRL